MPLPKRLPGTSRTTPRLVALALVLGLLTALLASPAQAATVTPAELSIIAGDGSSGVPVPGPATDSQFNNPSGVALDADDNLYVGDQSNRVVEKIDPDGDLTIFAGDGSGGAPTPGPATDSHLGLPIAVATDGDGNVYIADYTNHVVEKVDTGGNLTIFAGDGSDAAPTPGPATDSPLRDPDGVAVDADGNVYIADYSASMILKVDGDGTCRSSPATAVPARQPRARPPAPSSTPRSGSRPTASATCSSPTAATA